MDFRFFGHDLACSVDAAPTFAELERRYDGPIPEPLRRAALFGSTRQALGLAARAEARFLAALIDRQIETMRDRGAHPDDRLLADLALYRRERARFVALAGALGFADHEAPSATDGASLDGSTIARS